MQNRIDTPEPRFAVRGDRRNGVDRLSLVGELDRSDVSTFEGELEGVAHAGGALIIDLRELEAVDSDGVRALEATAQHAGEDGWWLFIVNGRDQVRHAFELAGADMLLSDTDISDVLAGGRGVVPDFAPSLAGGAEDQTTSGRQGATLSDWREQEVENETRSREINEWIDESNESNTEAASPFVCECSDGECTSTIDLTHVEYEEVRAHGTHFAIATDHESPDLDLMVSERIGFAIIRKLPGFPARLANASDPRIVRAGP